MDNEKLWNEKSKLVYLLNNENYKDAINCMIENIDNLDTQFCEMFITGFDITYSKKIPDKLVNKIDSLSDNLRSFRERYRWSIIKSIIKEEIKLKNE